MTMRASAGLARWLVAGSVAGAAIAVTIAAILVLGGRQTPEALDYVPDDAIVVAELRLDLPGDQLQRVGNLLAHFPGFADQSTLAEKLDRAGDRLLELLSNGAVNYTTAIKPWVSGPAYLGLLDLGTEPRGYPRSGLLVATTNGAAGCDELLAGLETGTETYRGLAIEVVPDGRPGACVLDGRYVLAGDLAAVKAGLDARANGTGIGGDERYRGARASLSGEQLATAYARGDVLGRLGEPSGPLPGVPAMLFGTDLPDWSIIGIRAEDDALVLDWASAPTSGPSAGSSPLDLPRTHSSELARHVPGTAIAYAEVQGAGASVINALTLLRAQPALGEALGELDGALAGFGGVERLLGWVDDAGIVVVNDGFDMIGELAAAALLLAPDDATAAERADNYRSLLALAALGGVVELETTTVNDVEVTTVTVGDSAGLPFAEPLQIRLAVTGRIIVVGTTEAAMDLILGVDEARSLARSEAFGRARAHGLSNPRMMLYASVGHAIAFGGAVVPPDEMARFQTDIKPYIAPIEALQITTTDGPDGSRARIVMTVTQPQEP